jgi:hypothetical protein
MKLEEQLDIVRKVVSDYFDKYGEETLPAYLRITEKEHIIYIGTSLLCSKWNVGYPGGDFVKAIVDNDLSGVFSRADHVNEHCIKFYLMLMYNVGMPTSLLE